MEKPNTNYIDQLSGANYEFRNKLIAILKRELPEEINAYQLEIEAGNTEAAAQIVHKLKHKISMLGLEESYYLAENYEDNLVLNSKILQPEFEIILKSMQEFVACL